MAEESEKEQLQQSGNNRTAHGLYASGSIYAATKVGVATKIQILVRPKPDQLDRLLRPCNLSNIELVDNSLNCCHPSVELLHIFFYARLNLNTQPPPPPAPIF